MNDRDIKRQRLANLLRIAGLAAPLLWLVPIWRANIDPAWYELIVVASVLPQIALVALLPDLAWRIFPHCGGEED